MKGYANLCKVMTLLGLFFTNKILVIDSWIEFLISAVVFTIIYAISTYFVMMNDYEKDVFRGPVKNFIKKFSRKKQKVN